MLKNNGNSTRESMFKGLMRDIAPVLCSRLSELLLNSDLERLDLLEEIRLRADKPLMLQNYCSDWFISHDGKLCDSPQNAVIVKQDDIARTLELMSENSIYAFQDEIRNGYITIKGGHRIGISGRAVMEGQCVKNIRDVSGLNIRISNQVLGCSRSIINFLLNRGSVLNTLLISPPQCGKTTMLRDIARSLSDGIPELDFKGVKVGIVDERSEIAACIKGVPQNQVGCRTDVLDGCPKRIGMSMMIRSMSPKVIITDEIGGEGDRDAVLGVINAGVKIVASAHGYNISELKSRREVLRLMEEKVFERYLVLDSSRGPGTLAEVVDGYTMKAM
jgi:stage III sporulation protein AA